MKIFSVVLLLTGILLAQSKTVPSDSVIEKFSDKISLQFITNYYFENLSGESLNDEKLSTNRPLNLGIGGGYGDFTWSSILSFSFGANEDRPKTKASGLGFNYFGDRFIGSLFFHANDGFYAEVDDSTKYRKVDFLTVSAGVDLAYILNKEHSLRAAYSLDRKQKKSNGSFIFGMGVYYNGFKSRDALFSAYKDYQQFVHTGPSVGYSHSWVWGRGWFYNMMGVFTLSFGKNLSQDQWLSLSQVFPRFSFGYHAKKWSIHFPFSLKILQITADKEAYKEALFSAGTGVVIMNHSNVFFSASSGMMVTRRF
jgi:hypothetical protein